MIKEVKKIACKCPACPTGELYLIRLGSMKYTFECDNSKCQTNRPLFEPKEGTR